MPERMPVVFVSSTSRDLGSFRRAVRDQLWKSRVFPDEQEGFTLHATSVKEKLRGTIAQSDAVICLIGIAFGVAPPSEPDKSYTQLEYEIAKELGKPVYLLVAADDCRFDAIPAEGESQRRLQAGYKERILTAEHDYGLFREASELIPIAAAIAEKVKAAATNTPAPTNRVDLLSGIQSLPGLPVETPLNVALERLLAISLAPLISWLMRPPEPSSEAAPQVINDIASEFWNSPTLFAGQLVRLAGSLSPFAPLFVGPSYIKRNLHQHYRKHDIDPVEAQLDKSLIDAKLGFSAGQMSWRLNLDWIDYVYLGLYHSIVRNAIPVFVRKATFDEQVQPQLKRFGTRVVEATVTGRLGPILPFEETLKTIGASTDTFESLRLHESFGIFVDAAADPETGISVTSRGRYLDGDIWLAVSHARHDSTDTGFLVNVPGVNLSDGHDFQEHVAMLKQRTLEKHASDKMIYQFDQVNRPFPNHPQSISTVEVIHRLGKLDDLH